MFLAEFFERGALNHRVFCSLQYLGTTEPRLDPDGVEAKTGTTREGKYGYDTGDLFRMDGAAGDEVVFKVNGVVAEETGVFKSVHLRGHGGQ